MAGRRDRRHGHERVLHGEALEVRLFLNLEFTLFSEFDHRNFSRCPKLEGHVHVNDSLPDEVCLHFRLLGYGSF